MDKYDKLPLPIKVQRLKAALSHSNQSEKSYSPFFVVTNLQYKVISKMSCGREAQVLISGLEGGPTLLEQSELQVSLSCPFPATITRLLLTCHSIRFCWIYHWIGR